MNVPRPFQTLAAALLSLAASTAFAAEKETFDTAANGKLPAGWVTALTGAGQPQWLVDADPVGDAKNRVLKQIGTADYPLCVREGLSIADGFVEARIAALGGHEAAGLVWRYRDAKNYYVARLNPVEGNVRFYVVKDGQRKQLGGVKAELEAKKWLLLRVEFHGGKHRMLLGGKLLFEHEDATFAGAGTVGLWTKDDTAAAFDDVAWGKE